MWLFQMHLDKVMVTRGTESKNGTNLLRMRLAWGRRREGADLPAPELPAGTYLGKTDNQGPNYLLCEVFTTPEEAAEAMIVRRQNKSYSRLLSEINSLGYLCSARCLRP